MRGNSCVGASATFAVVFNVHAFVRSRTIVSKRDGTIDEEVLLGVLGDLSRGFDRDTRGDVVVVVSTPLSSFLACTR